MQLCNAVSDWMMGESGNASGAICGLQMSYPLSFKLFLPSFPEFTHILSTHLHLLTWAFLICSGVQNVYPLRSRKSVYEAIMLYTKIPGL